MGDTPEGGGAKGRATTGSAAAASAPFADTIPDDEAVSTAAETPSRPTPRPSLRRISRPSFLLDLEAGTPVGEYEIQAQIGEGAMGTVYSAVHPVIGKTVAIKVLKPELCANQVTIDRFVQEAQAVNKIGHPNIVDVFSLGELADGRAYMVMEWLRGEDLKIRLARGPLSVAETCDILDGIARALEAAHAKDIVHRDLKPDNVFLHQVESGTMMVKLLDFGIAKLIRTQTMEKTQTGRMLGTPCYISPEQARGVDVTPRSDIYSLGVMAFEMLSGRPPFQGETAMDLVVKHLNEPPPPLSQLVRVPKPLELCVMRMLDKDPARRPSLPDVRQILSDPTQRTSTVVMLQRPGRRWPAILGVLVLVAGAGTGAYAWQAGLLPLGGEPAAPPPPPPAEPAPPPTAAAALAPEPAAGSATVEPTWSKLEISVAGSKDAVILIDGVERGRGSALKVDVVPGSHAIEVRPPKAAAIKRDVDVAAGEAKTVKIDVPVAPRPVARPVARPVVRPKPPVKPPGDDDLMRPKNSR